MGGTKTYRYHTDKGLRRKAEPLGQFDTSPEIRSEDFESLEVFAMAIATRVYELIIEDGGEEDESV